MARSRILSWPLSTLIFAALLFFDQYTKHAIASTYLQGESRAVWSWLSLTYLQNTGALWSSFQDGNTAFIWLSVAALGALLYWHNEFRTTIERICYALILAGISGNLVDRIGRGFVVDFLDLGWWPVFNIADSAIVTGVIVYLFEQWRKSRGTKSQRRRSTKT